MNTRITLRDIAKAAGSHYSTISLALRDSPRISESLRNKIKKVAADMGYVPDPALSALNAYRNTKVLPHYQSTIAWIDNWKAPANARDEPIFAEYFEGATARARELGYQVEEFRMNTENMTPDAASRILHNRGIEGLLLAPQPRAGVQLPLKYEHFCAVTFGFSLFPRRFHLVTNHQFHSMTLALEKLVALGYRRIGLFMHKGIDAKVDHAYSAGYWTFFQNTSEALYLEPCLVKYNEYKNTFKDWFKAVNPDAVVSIGDLAIIDWLKELGASVPDDVGYVRLSMRRDEDYFSGIHENGLLTGQTAVDFLVNMLQHRRLGFPEIPIRILIEGSWRQGKTVRSLQQQHHSP